MDATLRSELEALLGSAVASATPVVGGFTTAHCWSVSLDDGRRVFVKLATDDESMAANRTEALVLTTATGGPLPRLVARSDDGTLLVTDDLSGAEWSVGRFGADFWSAVAAIGTLNTPDSLHRVHQGAGREWWSLVADDGRFAPAVGISQRWFAAAVPLLIDASRTADTSGGRLVHGDLAPGNWCHQRDAGWRFVDWGSAHLGNPFVDDAIAAVRTTRVLGTATMSGRLRAKPEFAAFVGGRFAAELLDIDWAAAPALAREQRVQDIRAGCLLTSALLGLPSPFEN